MGTGRGKCGIKMGKEIRQRERPNIRQSEAAIGRETKGGKEAEEGGEAARGR